MGKKYEKRQSPDCARRKSRADVSIVKDDRTRLCACPVLLVWYHGPIDHCNRCRKSGAGFIAGCTPARWSGADEHTGSAASAWCYPYYGSAGSATACTDFYDGSAASACCYPHGGPTSATYCYRYYGSYGYSHDGSAAHCNAGATHRDANPAHRDAGAIHTDARHAHTNGYSYTAGGRRRTATTRATVGRIATCAHASLERGRSWAQYEQTYRRHNHRK
jgi:hypothetical protein